MKNTLSKAEIQVENLKMWLTEQIQRYGAREIRNRSINALFGEQDSKSKKDAFKEVLARLAEDENQKL